MRDDRNQTEPLPPNQRRWLAVGLFAIFIICLAPDAAFAWGPGTHITLAQNLLENLSLLPAGVAAIIAAHRRHFQYGNVATDIVLAKKMSRVKQVCHRWETGFKLLEDADSEAGRAFAYGYLAHLAADTVAHNQFLPRQIAVSRSTVSFGHFYWEVRADAALGNDVWPDVRDVVRGHYTEPTRLLKEHIRATMLSFSTNTFLFRRMNLMASEEAWLRSVRFWSRISRHDLDQRLLYEYQEESMQRILDVLSKGDRSKILEIDPNGNALLAYAKAQRKQLKQLKRAGLSDEQLIKEAAAGHAPKNRALTKR